MSRPTKSEIERLLLAGTSVPWVDATGKSSRLQLTDPKQRRLLAFLLTSRVREPVGLPDSFITGLADAFNASDDPASTAPAATGATFSDRAPARRSPFLNCSPSSASLHL